MAKKNDPVHRAARTLRVATKHPARVVGRLVRKVSKKPGSAPGMLVYTGAPREEKVRFTLIDYGPDGMSEVDVEGPDAFLAKVGGDRIAWLNVDGLHDVASMEKLGEALGIHPLALEDVLSTGQRPKLEEYDGYFFIVIDMLRLEDDSLKLSGEQVSLFLGPGWVLSFQERAGDCFDGVRGRIREGKGRIRRMQSDYLAYALIDELVDQYFSILEKLGDAIERLETEVLEDPSPQTMRKIHELKREMLVIRKAVWPVRELINGLVRSESDLIQPATEAFLRDVYDHTIQVIDTLESLRDVVGGLIDLYLSSVSNRMNEIMKVLTIMASIFIPLTFFAGIYGMNFEFMPELHYRWAYPLLLVVMAAVAVGMLIYFRRRDWL